MPNAYLTSKIEEKNTKVDRLAKIFTEHKAADGRFNLDASQVDEVRSLNTELEALGTEIKSLNDLEDLEAKNAARVRDMETPKRGVPFAGGRVDTKGMGSDGYSHPARVEVGRAFVESKSFSGRTPGMPFKVSMPDVEVKTLMTTSAGWSPFVPRIPNVALSPQQMPKIIDVFPTGTTSVAAMKWMQETVYTNNAAGVAEGGTYPEGAFALTEQTQNVIKLATFLPVTDEQLEDVEGLRDYVDGRLELQMGQLLDRQLVTGSGVGANLLGIDSVTGIQTGALVAGDAYMDAILKAITAVRVTGFSEPTAILANPSDFALKVRLLKTADGLYIWGHPSQTGPATLWGLPVVESTYITAGTARVGDFRGQTQVYYRKGLEFLMSNSHGTYFAEGKQAIRCDMRAVLVVFRPTAIYKATGL